MKSLRLGTIAALSTAALATIGTPAIVHAGTTTTTATHTAACQPYLPKFLGEITTTGGLNFTQSGVINNSPTQSRKIICPIARASAGVDSTTVFIDGEALFGSKISCGIYSFHYDGTMRAQKSVSGTGLFDVSVTFTVQEAPTYTYLSMICTLPSQGHGTLFGAIVNTYND